tara:strand:+ start:49 stop:1818 length:1770 start_codon:yes stop_codon:yes gene_type:complete
MTEKKQFSYPRPEYPRPILKRDHWLNLNGRWDFFAGNTDQDPLRAIVSEENWTQNIVVPFAPNSQSSGVVLEDEPSFVAYRREFDLPAWDEKQVFLNIGASDYATTVFINGQNVGKHTGGYTPFSFCLTPYLKPQRNTLIIVVEDSDSWQQPRGKQAGTTRWPIDYDPIIGIWQTVWLEPKSNLYLSAIRNHFSLDSGSIFFTYQLSKPTTAEISTVLRLDGEEITRDLSVCDDRNEIRFKMRVPNPCLWSVKEPNLYELEITISENGEILDRVESYCGLREIEIRDDRFLLNGEDVFLSGVLDQGYFPNGWYTAEDDQALKLDIELCKKMGFNFVRKHQKLEDPRYLFWADRLGILVWDEMPSGRIFSSELIESTNKQWIELVTRDAGHPCVVGWVPFNESWGIWHVGQRPQQRAFADSIYHLTKALDPSRPVIGNDGWEYSLGDLWTLHVYYDDKKALSEKLKDIYSNPQTSVTEAGKPRPAALPGSNPSRLPILLTECGGIGFLSPGNTIDAFAYGPIPKTEQELEIAILEVISQIERSNLLRGFVWTQLTDVQQEINGLLYFDRKPKIALEKIKKIMTRPNIEAR